MSPKQSNELSALQTFVVTIFQWRRKDPMHRSLFRSVSTLALILLVTHGTLRAQKFDGLALTPPMGWNSWNKFGCNVDEQLIRQAADAIVAQGMLKAGYTYVVIDDCWQGTRDSLGWIHPNPERFPSGMKALADYIHAKGLKFGIYSCAGYKTCGGHPASRGHEFQDALTYAQWGVDYLKYDWCNTEGLNAVGAYTTMRDALFAAGRPVVFSICEWGDNQPWLWAKDVGHLWRTTGDITPCFECDKNFGTWSSLGVMRVIEQRKNIRQYAGPGHWNDPDMLEVGNGMAVNEDRAHFSLWCMMAAPLMAGNEISSMSKATKEILTNPEAIAIDQDSLGIQGYKFTTTPEGVEVWVKPLAHGDWAFCFLNRSEKPCTMDFDWISNGFTDQISKKEFDPRTSSFAVRDAWQHHDAGDTHQPLRIAIPSRDVAMFHLTKLH
jgi:alpha-galactosidase